MNEAELVKIQQWRASIKKFDATKKIPSQSWEALEKSLILSPSSYGLQPWKFLVVTSDDVKKKLRPHSWDQSQVTDCSHFVVMTYRNQMDEAYIENYVQNIAETRGVTLDKLAGYKNVMVANVVKGKLGASYKDWAARQVYIALGNFMTSAAALGIDTCPMEGIDPEHYDKILELAGTEFSTVVACAAGYRHPEDAYSKLAKVRFDKTVVVKTI